MKIRSAVWPTKAVIKKHKKHRQNITWTLAERASIISELRLSFITSEIIRMTSVNSRRPWRKSSGDGRFRLSWSRTCKELSGDIATIYARISKAISPVNSAIHISTSEEWIEIDFRFEVYPFGELFTSDGMRPPKGTPSGVYIFHSYHWFALKLFLMFVRRIPDILPLFDCDSFLVSYCGIFWQAESAISLSTQWKKLSEETKTPRWL